jgi:hypothetical protein
MPEAPAARDAKELVTWLIERAGGDPNKVAQGAEVNVSTIRKWARGRFPRTRRSSAILAVHAWAIREFGTDYPPAGFPSGGLPAMVDQAARGMTTPRWGGAAGGRRLWLVVPGVVLAGVLVVVLVVTLTPTAQPAGQPPDFVPLHVGEPPSPGELASPAPCRAAPVGELHLPGKFRGHGFVQLMADQETPVHFQLVYGPHLLALDLIVHPGVADRYLGGTLIQFSKYDTTIEKPNMVNPPVKIRVNEPVCILTGTSADGVHPKPVLHVIPPREHWTKPPPNPPANSTAPT